MSAQTFTLTNTTPGSVFVYPDTGEAVPEIYPASSAATPTQGTFTAKYAATLQVQITPRTGSMTTYTVYLPVLYATNTVYYPSPQAPVLIAQVNTNVVTLFYSAASS